MKKIALASLLLVTGCIGLYDEPLYMKDNHQIFLAVCNGAARDMGDCYALASKRCAGNFEVVQEGSENVASMEQSFKNTEVNRTGTKNTVYGDNSSKSLYTANGTANTYGAKVKSGMITRNILFYCK